MLAPQGDGSSRAFGGRYEPTALLKSGLGVETWLGRDRESDQLVVIKRTLAEVGGSPELRLAHEADVLRSVQCPWVAPLLGIGRDGASLWIATPFVPGVTLAEWLGKHGRLAIREAVEVGRSLLRALESVHAYGVVHGDLKPGNVILGEGGFPRHVTLIDFSLARSVRLDASLRSLPAGSVAYVSPEQAGLIHRAVDERSDLYSLGIVLFQCLAGRPPFSGATVTEVLRQHLALQVPDLTELAPAVPRSMNEIVQRFLKKDPRDRYQSAHGALADLDELALALDRGIREPIVAVGASDRRATLTEPAFEGRERELSLLEEHLSRAARGESLLVRLEGESGAGKSRLLDQAAKMLFQRGAWVLRGGCTDRAVPRPLEVLDLVASDIMLGARHEPERAEALRSRLGEHLETLCAVLPRFCELLSRSTRLSPGPEAHGEERTLRALVALLDALGAAGRPAAILLDDCQWLDELSLKLLAAWQRSREAEGRTGGALVIAAYRPQEVPSDSPLHRLAPDLRITLAPLSGQEVRRMAESMAGAVPAEALRLLERLSEGNPFLVAAVLEGLVECGALVATSGGWEIAPAAIQNAQASARASVLLSRRLDRLDPQVLDLLSVGAVLGKTFDPTQAAELASQSAVEVTRGVADARRRHLLWVDFASNRCTFMHDRIRGAVLDRLPPGAQQSLHKAAAELLSRTAPPGPDRELDLAFHFDGACEYARALPHALAAASAARARSALEVAERYYRIAEHGARDAHADAETRRRVAEELGEVLLLRGHYDEAFGQLSKARAIAEGALIQARIEGKLGELAFKRGDVHAASDALERALSLLGRSVPTRPAMLFAATIVQVLVQILHTFLPRSLVSRRRLEEGEADLLAVRLFSRLAYANWFLRGQVATFWAHLSEMNLAERYPPTRELAQAYSEHAISVTGLPRVLFRRGVRYAERGLAIRTNLGDVWGQGQSLSFHGMLLYAFGGYGEALEKFSLSRRVLARTGDRWEANIAGVHVAYCQFRLGALRDAVAECRRVHREAVDIGDRHAGGTVLEVWAKASGGAVPAELVAAALRSSEGDPQTYESVLQAEGTRLIGTGRPREAALAFAAADRVARAVNLKSEYVSYAPIWRAHALRLAALQAARETGVLLPDLLAEAERALRGGLRMARRYRGNLPMALRERAQLSAMRGRLARARRDLDRSLVEAERSAARYEQAQTLLARGELGRVMGVPGAEEEAVRARAALRELDATFACSPLQTLPPDQNRAGSTLSLVDRFASIVDEGRKLASAVTSNDVHAALAEAARVLLRGEANMTLSAEPSDRRVLACSGPAAPFSVSLVERAFQESGPVVLGELLDQQLLPDSVLLSSARSALCAPILVAGRPAACLYVTHRRVGDLFGEEEKKLAGYLTTLAGASLEKAEAFAALQAFSRTLEQRVADRTAELSRTNDELDANLRKQRETHEQLVQAAKMMAVGTLVAGLSHEINNPITVILGYAQLHLGRMRDDDPLRPAMVAIERQAKRCADLVGALLDFSRKGPAACEDVAVGALVERVVALESSKTCRRAVKLERATSSEDACRVHVSRTKIESALLNLLDNAADASPPGAVVRIEAAPSARNSREGVELRVHDDGKGIDASTLDHIFDPFFSTKPVGEGTGLGLSLARRFVEEHEGELSIESSAGEGTTARLWLPASHANHANHEARP